MMRISGITIPDNKQVRYGLTMVYGVGLARATQVAQQVSVDPLMKIKDLTPDQESALRTLVESFLIEGELKREISQNIKRLKDIQSYRGMRHARNLTVRGQRTKTNSRTVRGNKRNTMASGRTKVSKT
ncbi:MAG: 30S ribosomal protein S13 [Candidatus Pacebacteria bacterium]|nr:30S ribosomal protein S13 [Candidatus Paceibacterota bacterium]